MSPAPQTRSKKLRRARPPELSEQTISAAALALIDEAGLEAFSTRKLGRALGCEAMAIYWYYPSKDALLDAVVDRLVAPVAEIVGDEATDWVEVLRRIAHAYRRIAHDHPRAFPLLATRRFASAGTYAFLERLFERAQREHISDRTSARWYRIVSSYCSGFSLNELAPPRGAADAPHAASRRRFPRVAAVWGWLGPRYLDEIFAHGLEVLLSSIRVPGPARALEDVEGA